jgi:catechol 2,3-dioxygenase-like lactoylglutathione lyase family enzyme
VSDRPRVTRVYETVVYASDVAGTAAFYEEVVGLRGIEPPDELSAAFRAPDGGLVLIFDPERSSAAGRFVPPHGARGAGHLAFSVEDGALDDAKAALAESGVEIEREIGWPRGGRSLYFRDPAGNSVELVEGEIWAP